MKPLKIAALALAAVLAFAGCAPSEQIDGKFKIVASTNVWGDVAKAVGGDFVEVTSIIDSPKKDPHSYEASARDQLAVEKANLVIANGGGYDDFIEKMAQAAGNKRMFRVASAVTAVAWQENEHLWYSISAVGEATYALADTLAALDKNNSATYLANADKFVEGLTGVAGAYGEIRKSSSGKNYFGTEKLADWLLKDLGMVNKTPAKFTDAIENETDVAPATMKESLDLFKSGKIDYLVVNYQTQNAQTKQIAEAAQAAGVPIILLTEVLPEGIGYVEWMGENASYFAPAN